MRRVSTGFIGPSVSLPPTGLHGNISEWSSGDVASRRPTPPSTWYARTDTEPWVESATHSLSRVPFHASNLATGKSPFEIGGWYSVPANSSNATRLSSTRQDNAYVT